MDRRDGGPPELSRGEWFFATPEHVNGGRTYVDKTDWKILSTPADDVFSTHQYSFENWDVNTKGSSSETTGRGVKNARDRIQNTNVAKAQKAGQTKSQAGQTKYKKAKKDINTQQSQEHAKTSTPQDMRGKSAGDQAAECGKVGPPSFPTKQKFQTAKQPVSNNATEAAAPVIVHETQNLEQWGRTLEKKQNGKRKTKAYHAKDNSALPKAENGREVTTEALTATGMAKNKNNKKDKKVHVQGKEATFVATAENVPGKGTNSVPLGGKLKAQEKSVGSISMETLPLIDIVKQAVDGYIKQSPSHFALYIDVAFSEPNKASQCNASQPKLGLVFQNFNQQVHKTCRQYTFFQGGVPNCKVQVRERGRWISIQAMLNKHFPPSKANTSLETLKAYWDASGNTFNWTGLPTELKEHIIQFCFVKNPDHRGSVHVWRCLKIMRARNGGRSACEISDQLGPWKALLQTSTQVRAITLRLRLSGCLAYSKGLCVTSSNYSGFQNRLRRFNRRSQITESGSVPPQNNPKDPGHMLRQAYRDSPKLYPELHRYATFFHGIRQIDLSFSLNEFYRFFEVTAGDFDSHMKPANQMVTFDVLNKLPFLNEIVVRFPKDRHRHWCNNPREPGRPLFHYTHPCPRVIMRILYERIADVLAGHDKVKVKNFLDKIEEARFSDLRRAAREMLEKSDPPNSKLTINQLLELNDHSSHSGGIQLSGPENEADNEHVPFEADHFYPIKCKCAVPCTEAFEFF